MPVKVEKVMEIVGVSSPIANAALVAEGGDVNNASSVLLKKEREKSDASGSVQRMQAGIEEEAANVVKKVGALVGQAHLLLYPSPEEGSSSSVPSIHGGSFDEFHDQSTSRAAGRRRRKASNRGYCITAATVVVDLVPLHLTKWSDSEGAPSRQSERYFPSARVASTSREALAVAVMWS